jgi:tRNA(fMet)-specific endonuclease VapC
LSYLLDTNACIAVINGRPSAVRQRLREVLKSGERVAVSAIALFEFWYGVAKSARIDANTERLAVFLGQFDTVSFDLEDARAAGTIRTRLERSGMPIGAYDTLIGGQAIRHRMILVTANEAEFQRVPGLRCENWATLG